MKDSRYRVDLSKRLDGRRKGAWLIKAKAIAGKLLTAVMLYFVIAYPWNRYKNKYLPLLAETDKRQTEIAAASAALNKAGQKLENISRRYKTIAMVQKQRISWTEKLFNIARLIPSKMSIAEIGLRQIKGRKQKQKPSSDPQKAVTQKSVYIRGLIPTLTLGEYLAKIVALTKEINTDPEFTKDFFPVHLNYNKLVKLRQGERQEEMIEFELEAATR